MLSAPFVVGPITPCSRSVLVRGQLPGAFVTIFANNVLVGSAAVGTPEALVPLLPGVALLDGRPADVVIMLRAL